MEEVWMDLACNNNYECSNTGKIRSKTRVMFRKNGRKHSVKGKLLSPNTNQGHSGYQRTMIKVNGKSKTISFHREILKSFKPHPLQDKLECNHIDGNKLNNNIDNLEWVTKRQNIKHSFELGLQENFIKKSRLQNIKKRKLTKDQITWARIEKQITGCSYLELSKKLKVAKKTLICAMKGVTYKDIQ